MAIERVPSPAPAPRRLEDVLADYREEAAILRSNGHEAQAVSIERVCDAVAASMVDYLMILSEEEARSRSGKGTEFLRTRFPAWEAAGMAFRDGRNRRYRAAVVPVRPNLDLARAEARRDARLAS